MRMQASPSDPGHTVLLLIQGQLLHFEPEERYKVYDSHLDIFSHSLKLIICLSDLMQSVKRVHRIPSQHMKAHCTL